MQKLRDFCQTIGFSILVLLIAMFSIQSGASLAKQLFPRVGPIGTSALRLLVATLILSSISRPWRYRITRRETCSILGYGLSLGAMNLMFYMALARIPLGIAVAIEFTGPLAVSLFASRKIYDFAWALLAVVGLFLILSISQFSADLDPIGVLFALAAGGCWALYIVFGQRAGGTAPALTVTTLGMLVAAALVLPLGIIERGSSLFDLTNWPLAIGVGIFSSALPYSLEMIALKRLPAKNFGIMMSLEPAAGALSGWVFLSERLSMSQTIAIFFIVLASLGSALSIPPTQKGEPLPPEAN